MKLPSIKLKQAKVGTLLGVGIIAIIGLMVSATIYSNYLSNRAQDIIEKSSARIFDVLTIQRDTGELFSAMEDVVVFQDQQRLESARDRINSLLERAEKTIQESGEKEVFNDTELKKAQNALDKAKEVSGEVIDSKIDTIQKNENVEDGESDYFYERNIDTGEQLTRMRNTRFEMLGVFHDMTMRSDEEYRGAMDLVGRAQTVSWVVIGISLALAILLGYYLVRSIKKIFDLKNEFVNIIAHDLRNPVTAIIGYLELITADKDKSVEEQHEKFQALDVAAQKLKSQISNLLEVGRNEAGRVKLNLEAVQPIEVLNESILRAKALAEISGIKIIYKKTDGKNVFVLADSSKLSDVLDNLISNAIKYNRKNGTVTISTQSTGEMFSISVADTGHGIPEDQKQKIFTKYTRLETNKNKGVGGTGLGLYTVKLSMDKMKGTVEFESKEKIGTKFIISLKKVNKNYNSGKDQDKS